MGDAFVAVTNISNYCNYLFLFLVYFRVKLYHPLNMILSYSSSSSDIISVISHKCTSRDLS